MQTRFEKEALRDALLYAERKCRMQLNKCMINIPRKTYIQSILLGSN